MTALTLLAGLTARDVILTLSEGVDGPKVRWKAPSGALTDVDLAALRAYKADLIALLGGPNVAGARWSEPCGPAHGWHPGCERCLELASTQSRAIPCGHHAALVADHQRATRFQNALQSALPELDEAGS